MCAINGFNFKNEELVKLMNRSTVHRGPDGTGVFSNESVTLGHNRLSIIDPRKIADQPMKSNDNSLTIVFNGEIYNYRELRNDLQNTYTFKTNSDTEVILAAYQKWGKDCVTKFNGIFAFAIWDVKNSKLFLARDHIGVKPLYYFWNDGVFIFSSEIKAILKHKIPRKLNRKAFSHYFRMVYVPEPLTIFEDIFKLPPAHIAILRKGTLSIEKYWDVKNNEYYKGSKNELVEEVRNCIFRAVDRQLVSDKPLGVYLSGGIDSSSVLHSVAQVRNNITTFSIGFELRDDEERKKFNEDFELARRTAGHYRTNHHEVVLSSTEVITLFQKAALHLDEPISNPTALTQLKLASFAKQTVDVVLGGDGGDELFGGYERYRLSLLSDYYQKLPFLFRSLLDRNEKLKKLNTLPGVERFELFMFQKNQILNRVLEKEAVNTITRDFFTEHYFKNTGRMAFNETFLDVDRKSWLVDESLVRTDKTTMAFGLEERVPLLDKEVVELAYQVPFKYKVTPFNTKVILKEAFRGRIPGFLYRQPKRGWFSPAAKWLRHDRIYQFAQEVLSPDYHTETSTLFKWDEIHKILEDHYSRKKYNLVVLWTLLTFQLWAREYKITL